MANTCNSTNDFVMRNSKAGKKQGNRAPFTRGSEVALASPKVRFHEQTYSKPIVMIKK